MSTTDDSLNLAEIGIARLSSKDNLRRFNCGVAEIDHWAQHKAYKFDSGNRARVFAATEVATTTAKGFYCLSLKHEPRSKLIEANDRNLYDKDGVPFIYITYLAVQRSCQGCGVGKLMLMDAFTRAYEIAQHVCVYGVALRSLNPETTKFYNKSFGFAVAPDEGETPLMILPIWSVIDLIESTA